MSSKLKRNSTLARSPSISGSSSPLLQSMGNPTQSPLRILPKPITIFRALSDEKLAEALEGYAFPIHTPFGRVLSLSADLYTFGRTLREIEEHVSKYIRPFLNYTTRRNIFGEKVRDHAKRNMLQQIPCSNSSHECIFLPPSDDSDPFRKIANIYTEQLRREKKPAISSSNHNHKMVHVYLQNNQSYANVMPWLVNADRFKLITLESNESGAIKINTIVSTVMKHADKAKFHIIQLQAESSKTKQRMDLTALEGQIEALKQEYPMHQFTCVLEATPLFASTGYSLKDQEDALAFFDFSVVRMNRFFGGQLASNFILAKRETLQMMKVAVPPPTMIEPTAMLRTAQILEFYKDNEIADRMKNSPNSTIFFEEIIAINERLKEVSVLNRIDLGNIDGPSENGRYSVTILLEGSETFLEEESRGYPVLLAQHLTVLLHDLFGIQVKCNRALKSTQNSFRFFDIPSSVMEANADTGFVELNSSTIDLDIHFLMSPQEVLYIATALEQITLYAPKLMKLYNKKTLKPKHFIPPEADLTFKACASFKYHEVDIEERSQTYANQLVEGAKILRTPANYFTISESWKEDKSVVFPLSAFPNSFPTKNRTIAPVEEGQEDDDEDEDETLSNSSRSIKKKDMSNSMAVQEARNLINRIKNNIPETDGSPKARASIEENPIPVLKLEEIQSIILEEEQIPTSTLRMGNGMATEVQQCSEELLAQIRRELKAEIQVEVRQEMEDVLKSRWAIREDLNLKEQVRQKDRRLKNLRIIFNFYASLKDVLSDFDKRSSQSNQNGKTAKKSASTSNTSSISAAAAAAAAAASQAASKRMSLNKFFKFCDDFELISPQQLDIKTLYILFEKVCPPNQSDIDFTLFQTLIEKMSHVLYQIAADEPDGSSASAPTHYDKIDLLSRKIGLDDPQFYKHKLKPEGLVNFSFVFHDKHQLFSNSNNSNLSAVLLNSISSPTASTHSRGGQQQQHQVNQQISKITSHSTLHTHASARYDELKQQQQPPSNTSLALKSAEELWQKDPQSMDAKLLYKDNSLSHQEILSEVISLSQPKNIRPYGLHNGHSSSTLHLNHNANSSSNNNGSSGLQSLQHALKQHMLANSMSTQNTNLPRSLKLISDSPASASPLKTAIPILHNIPYSHNNIINSIGNGNSHQSQYTSQQQLSSNNGGDSVHIRLLKRAIPDLASLADSQMPMGLSPTIGDASTRKKQMLLRAKQIASVEREKEESIRMKSLPNEYPDHSYAQQEMYSPVIRLKHNQSTSSVSKFDSKSTAAAAAQKLLAEPPILPNRK